MVQRSGAGRNAAGYTFSHYTVNNMKIDGNTFNLNNNVTVSGAFSHLFSTEERYREMASMNSGTVTGSIDITIDGSSQNHGVFINGRTVDISPFKIARYETTYGLWQEVYDWAVNNGYSSANTGTEGYPYRGGSNEGKGTDSAARPLEQKQTRPVTEVNWCDAIVWCNAYSEMSGRTPVYYYKDTNYNTVLKTSTNDSGINTGADTAVMKPAADGYRLPAEAEWEYAARGGNPSAAAWNYQWAGTNDGTALNSYAWYYVNSINNDYGVHPVGTKKANSAGLYDMSGNVVEWCWDWGSTNITSTTPALGASSGSDRVSRGGGWWFSAYDVSSAPRGGGPPSASINTLGFRVACSQ